MQTQPHISLIGIQLTKINQRNNQTCQMCTDPFIKINTSICTGPISDQVTPVHTWCACTHSTRRHSRCKMCLFVVWGVLASYIQACEPDTVTTNITWLYVSVMQICEKRERFDVDECLPSVWYTVQVWTIAFGSCIAICVSLCVWWWLRWSRNLYNSKMTCIFISILLYVFLGFEFSK